MPTPLSGRPGPPAARGGDRGPPTQAPPGPGAAQRPPGPLDHDLVLRKGDTGWFVCVCLLCSRWLARFASDDPFLKRLHSDTKPGSCERLFPFRSRTSPLSPWVKPPPQPHRRLQVPPGPPTDAVPRRGRALPLLSVRLAGRGRSEGEDVSVGPPPPRGQEQALWADVCACPSSCVCLGLSDPSFSSARTPAPRRREGGWGSWVWVNGMRRRV